MVDVGSKISHCWIENVQINGEEDGVIDEIKSGDIRRNIPSYR
jgi:hypothetical protein